jgi:hypothetical protein
MRDAACNYIDIGLSGIVSERGLGDADPGLRPAERQIRGEWLARAASRREGREDRCQPGLLIDQRVDRGDPRRRRTLAAAGPQGDGPANPQSAEHRRFDTETGA